MKKIYVISPYGLITGGPDALHQMVYYLNKIGYEAYIVYSDIKSHKYDIPPEYKIYVNKYLTLNEIEDLSTNCIVVPETESEILSKYRKIKKYLWWLSVNNDLDYSGMKNKIKKIISKIKIKNIRKLYKINTLKIVLKHKKFDFKKSDENITHLCASYYAYDYVVSNKKNNNNVFLCIEPISKIFLDKSKLVTKNKQDIILYNPKKNYEFTKKVILKCNDLQFVPLTGYSQKELIKMYQKSKVYIDFGTFPGAERIPKEAVINGCTIITGRLGASAYYNDVPIPDEFKIESLDKNLEIIHKKIQQLIKDYDIYIDCFSKYRQTVRNLENNFLIQLKEVFNNENKK